MSNAMGEPLAVCVRGDADVPTGDTTSQSWSGARVGLSFRGGLAPSEDDVAREPKSFQRFQ